MANWSDPRPTAVPRAATGAREAAFDAGLRSYMLSVYNYMVSAVLLSGVVAMLFANWSGAPALLGNGMFRLLLIVAPLGVVMTMSFGINRISQGTAQALFWTYSVLVGLSLSTLLFVYTGASVASAFFATAASFAGLSLYGYTTGRSLQGLGTFLVMGVFGLLAAMLINGFLVHSSAMSLLISVAGVLIFAGLTAYHTQSIKSGYFAVRGTEYAGKAAIIGALQLYLDFINMFVMLMNLMGNRRS